MGSRMFMRCHLRPGADTLGPMKLAALSTCCAVAFALGGCGGDGDSPEAPVPALVASFEAETPGVDVLVIVDNTRDMQEQLDAFSANAGSLFGAIDAAAGGPVDLHFGVTTMDLGAKDQFIGGCSGLGDEGKLIAADQLGNECVDGPDAFVRDVAADGQRDRNFDGTVADAAGCLLRQGQIGCGFEQPFEAARLALASNDAFHRAERPLAIVFITEEDDCSASSALMFDPSDSAETGPLGSFRCFRWGVTCESGPIAQAGEYTGCGPFEDSPYVFPVAGYADAFRAARAAPGSVLIGAVVGNAGPVVVEFDGQRPSLAPSCAGGDAVPPVRIDALLGAFPDRGVRASICANDVRPTLAQLGDAIGEHAVRTCVDGQVDDVASCSATLDDATLATCDAAGEGAPCFVARADAACADAGNASVIVRGAPVGARVAVTCDVLQ